MKKYTIRYRPSLGSFLDMQKIEWTSNDDDVTFKLKDDEEFATLIIEYIKWVETI